MLMSARLRQLCRFTLPPPRHTLLLRLMLFTLLLPRRHYADAMIRHAMILPMR